MNWESRYEAPDAKLWLGRDDTPADSCFYQHIKLHNLLDSIPKKSAPLSFALIGFKSDEGIERDQGRTGAFEGPTAIRERLAKLPIQKTAIECFDVGNIVCTDHNMEASQAALSEIVTALINEKICPIVIGGDHEIAYANYQGIAQVVPAQKRLGIINFDAHFDMHPAHSKPSAKTSFWQIEQAHKKEKRHFDYNCIGIQHAANIRQSFNQASQMKVNVIFADELHQGHLEKSFDFIDRVVDENDFIYLSLALDVFSPAFAPGVSSIQPLGLTPWQVLPLIRQAAMSGKMISYDIAELTPKFDIDHRTAKLAATFIYEIIHHHEERKH